MVPSAILQTKLHRPQSQTCLVARPRLVERLNAGLGGCLTLVSAPAGYGKTTLIGEWLQGLETRSAGLSLDEGDNDPRRFMDYLLAALRQIRADVGQAVEPMLRSPQPPPGESVMTALVNEITALGQAFVLVLDDYHVIHTPSIHQQLNFLLEHSPPQMQMVLISREDPPLPLPRLRARAGLAEIRQTDLRFSPEECTDFLQRVMALNLSPEDVAALERHTEGWIVGLQLAALSMRGLGDVSGFIQEFTGSNRFILDYLVEEVFERLPSDMQQFLLKTSILERLCGPLCDEVIGEPSSGRSQSVLEHLEHSNLFIIPLDQSRRWYRYHRLFAELLRQRLQQAAQMIPESTLHRSASRWFAKEGFFPEAIQHALAGEDWDRAAGLVAEQSVVLLRRGELMTLLGWFKSLPEEVICTRPQLCRDYGWALTLTGQLDAASGYFQLAEQAVSGDEALLGTILVGQAYNLRLRGSYQQAIDYARRAQQILPQADHLSHGLSALTLGFALWNSNSLREAEQAFMEVDQAAQQSNNQYARVTAIAFLGAIQAVYGNLRRSAGLCQQVIQTAGDAPTASPAHNTLGVLFYEWNDLASAVRHLQTGIEQSAYIGNWMVQCEGLRSLALLHLASGEIEAAESTLQKAHQLAQTHEVNPPTRLRNAACQVQISLAQDDLDSAQFWADQISEPADASLLYPSLGLTPARMLLARHEKNLAAQELEELYRTASKHRFGSGMIEIRALQALAAEGPGEALHILREALNMGRPEGFIRTFLNKGEAMEHLLERSKPGAGELKPYIQTLLSSFGGAARETKIQPLVEPMSERELEILRLLAQGLSNSEIAGRLIISVGTVKSHVHHILEKLGCDSRLQAVAKAREMGLLSQGFS